MSSEVHDPSRQDRPWVVTATGNAGSVLKAYPTKEHAYIAAHLLADLRYWDIKVKKVEAARTP